jgi:hypothetical protein
LADERLGGLIAEALEETPFHSVRSLANALKIPQTTIWRHLHSADYVVRNLLLIADTLSPAQKVGRAESAIALQKILSPAKHRGWHDLLTVTSRSYIS